MQPNDRFLETIARTASGQSLLRSHPFHFKFRLGVAAALLLSTFAGFSVGQAPLSLDQLAEEFQEAEAFPQQLDIAKEIIAYKDPAISTAFEPLLNHEDRHIRANAALVIAGLGDIRGITIIEEILHDHSPRPEGQGVGWGASDGKYHYELQVKADRFYALYICGILKDPRTIPILIAALDDPEFDYEALWALGEIGDEQALDPMLNKLEHGDATLRVHAIYALTRLGSKNAIPHLRELLEDHRKANIMNQISVADAASAAITQLESER